MAKRAAIILSGGRSERFQRAQETWQDKALVELLGKPLLVRSVENVQEVVEEVVVCVNNEKRKAKYSEVLKKHGITNVRLLIDEQSNRLGGPIVGTLTGLKSVKADYCLTLPSDMPLMKPQVADYLLNKAKDFQVVVPMWPNGRLETLVMAMQRNSVLEITDTLCHLQHPRSDEIIRGASKIALVTPFGEIKALDPNLQSFVNINSQEDLARLQTRQSRYSVSENIQLDLGVLPLSELQRLRSAAKLYLEGNFVESLKVFSSCAKGLEKGDSYFWAAISRENEGVSLLQLSQLQKESAFPSEQNSEAKTAFLSAVNDFRLEAERFEANRCSFLAERALADRSWCESWALGKLFRTEK